MLSQIFPIKNEQFFCEAAASPSQPFLAISQGLGDCTFGSRYPGAAWKALRQGERSGAEVRSWGWGGKTCKNDATGIGWVPSLTIVFLCFLWKINENHLVILVVSRCVQPFFIPSEFQHLTTP